MDNSKNLPEGISVWSLASGSKANCTLVCSEKAKILIDFGVSCRYAKTALSEIGLKLDDVGAVFITHEHSDHIAGLDTFFKKYDIPVHMTEPSYIAYTRGKGFYHRDRLTVHEPAYTVTLGDLEISSLPVRHDSAACVAYKVTRKDENKHFALGICTDIGCPGDELFSFFSDCTNIITECNHDVTMLKCGIYPEDLKYRILSDYGHTSNDDCANFVVRLAENGVKGVLLSHLSPENNTPELAVYTVREALEKSGKTVPYLEIAPRYELFKAFEE